MAHPAARAPLLISILNWNGLDDTLRCLASLTPPADGAWQVLVIDNGSALDPRPAIAARFPWAACVRLASNGGFAAGQNHGLRRALACGHEAVLMLNNDCEIGAAALRALLAHLRGHPRVAAVSPLVYCLGERARPQMVAAWLDWPRHRSVRPSRPDAEPPPHCPTMVPGTALMLRCAALAEIGLLDERYFAYYEDNDLSARLAAAGWRAAYCRQAQAWHASRPVRLYSATALYLSARNAVLFWSEHTPRSARRGLWRHLLAQSLAEIAVLRKDGETERCQAVAAGFWDGLHGRWGPPPPRLRAPAPVFRLMHGAPYLLQQLLADPAAALAARLHGKRDTVVK